MKAVDVILTEGQRACFRAKGQWHEAIAVENRGGLLRFSVRGSPVRHIAGAGMRRKVSDIATVDDRVFSSNGGDDHGDGEWNISTPEHAGRMSVCLSLMRGKFNLVGDSTLISVIAGTGLSSRLLDEPKGDA